MPELPDLQVISENLNDIYSNCRLVRIHLTDKTRSNAPIAEYNQVLLGKKIQSITRFGKEINILFENDNALVLHLMREGKFSNKDAGTKNIILKLEFDNGKVLIMSDFMGQAKVSLNPDFSDVPDPFDKEFSIVYLKQRLLTKKRMAIKSFLIDQANVLGIGNAYADEILWVTKLSPLTKCGSIPDEVIEILYNNIKFVLLNAIEKIKEKEPDIISGEIRSFMNVHNKNKKQSPTGYEILVDKVGGKITYYTEEQILYE